MWSLKALMTPGDEKKSWCLEPPPIFTHWSTPPTLYQLSANAITIFRLRCGKGGRESVGCATPGRLGAHLARLGHDEVQPLDDGLVVGAGPVDHAPPLSYAVGPNPQNRHAGGDALVKHVDDVLAALLGAVAERGGGRVGA